MSMRHCNFGTIYAAACFIPETSVKTAWHEPTSPATSIVIRLFKIIFFTASMFSSVVDVLERPGPQLNLCSAHSRLAKRHSQHFKCPCKFNLIFYTKLNTVSLIHIILSTCVPIQHKKKPNIEHT